MGNGGFQSRRSRGKLATAHGDLRGRADLPEETRSLNNCRGRNESERRVVSDVAIPRRHGFVAQQNKNMQLAGMMVRRAIRAGRSDNWSELMKSDELNPWMMAKLQESYHQARQEDDQRKSIVQQVMQKSTDFLRRIIAPAEGQSGHTVVRVPSLSPISA